MQQWKVVDMNCDSAHSTKLREERTCSMKDSRDGINGAHKILVNPLIAGSHFHYNTGKYTIASSQSGVTESTANPSRTDVHYNPKFLNQSYSFKKDNIHINPNYIGVGGGYVSTTSHGIHINPNFIPVSRAYAHDKSYGAGLENRSKYRYVRNNDASLYVPQNSSAPPKCEPKTASKYKLVYSTAPSAQTVFTSPAKSGIVIRSKYSLRTCQPNFASSMPATSTMVSRDSKKRVRYDFKRISRTKLVRRSVLRSRGSLTKLFKNTRRSYRARKQLFKLNRSLGTSECSIFKTYSRTKIVRKSVLRAQIDSRKLLRKSLNSSVSNLLEVKPLVNAKYKLVLECSSKKQAERNPNLNKSKRRRSAIAKITSKLRKNNQRCLFYNRFGRCKGKDKGTCNKIHDPLYVSICKKLPFGECTDKSCLLSHDVRPGKMPTCYHYLAGICKRDNCPYLHIKVNPKAPICHSFLQGYCPDVYNCLKRHEYVCPVFAEKGTCPKGRSCAHPHKIPTVHSKLLGDHQRPLMARWPFPPSAPSHPPVTSSGCIFLVSEDPEPIQPNLTDNPEPSEPLPFTRYFSMPIPSSSRCSSSPCSDPPTSPLAEPSSPNPTRPPCPSNL